MIIVIIKTIYKTKFDVLLSVQGLAFPYKHLYQMYLNKKKRITLTYRVAQVHAFVDIAVLRFDSVMML